MLVIIPQTFVPERTYILEIILGEFLGIPFEIKTSNEAKDYELQFEAGNLVIKNAFWEDEDYLSDDYIPAKVKWLISPFDSDEKIPVIYGEASVEGNMCYADVFASAFFMLTRWEEVVGKERDQHNRFPVEASLAYQQGFLHLPVVNMYVELLWSLLLQAGYQGKRKEQHFDIMNTCDVDTPFVWQKPRNVLGRLKFHLTISKKPWLWLTKELPSLFVTLFGIHKDPADTYDYLMDWSEKVGAKSYFFFMDHGFTEYDKYYKLTDKRIQKTLANIQKRGHYIGFHPSYNLYDDAELFLDVKREVEETIGAAFLPIGRQHYLRFETPTTWQVWEDAGMEWDSTLSYASVPGFRCGVCWPYSVFNVLTHQKLKLKEYPLTLMEQSCIHYLKHTPEQMQKTAISLLERVAKYKGKFILLWHNATLNTTEFKQYKPVFEYIMKRAIELKKK